MSSIFSSIVTPFKRARNRLSFLPTFSQDLSKFVATIDVDYVQRVAIGIEASSADHAKAQLRRAYETGTLFNDSAKMPILMHAFEPVRPDAPLQLASFDEVDDLPEADPSVDTMKCIGSAHALLRFARYVAELIEEAEDPHDAGAKYVGIDLPVDEINDLRKLLDALENC
ncbi:hypothetical protein ABEG10_38390 (plasmid) [Burkholderia cenocepacia]|uniref:hypothetical protein n=1 Tax=Burkholderia cepacia complex TaxID=87882 RepID=UPI001CF5133E|nr:MULTISPECIES: hypothetical protein [Burkholderia cepacia complex]MCA8355610.1 hypothetical protein [Burkholderia cepacia]MCO8402840.1 hypothetical protein [Burkholderia cenocepacia]MCO8415079.1 hypothetical protein [Burkholderia cenocepacia]MCO8423122.1 hypothetical protein [Burkholderia cenocepacia]MCO8474826.1 hypothetical protein [Burkholderia cenocepacia]